MTHKIPEHLQCDVLFLLVGANTLPNWVAAKLLLQPGGRVHLVYTKGVKKQAERLKEILEEDEKIPVSWFETAEADELNIYDRVKTYVQEFRKKDKKRIGLNYTGGTKMMAVHAHRAIIEAGESDLVFSYLNAGDLEMKFDYPPGGVRNISLVSPVRISIEKLCKLHDDSKKFKLETLAKCPDAARGLALVYSKEAGQASWQKWYDGLKKSQFDEQTLLPTEDDFSRDVESYLSRQRNKSYSAQAVSDIVQKVIDGYGQVLAGFQVQGGDTLQTVVKKNGAKDFGMKELTNWFNGLWLEHYTLSQLDRCRANADWNQDGLATNLRATSEEGRDFQADVLAVRGYQLYYFSCYTGHDPKTTKLKLFEAMVRAAQLGGDEARAAVVCCVNDYAHVRRQAEEDWECDRSRAQFEVFGREHLPNLADKIAQWVNSK